MNNTIVWGSRVMTMVLSLIGYLLMAIAFTAIARKKGIKNRWTAWVPIVQDWMLGCIADKYNYVVRGKKTCLRTFLLLLSVLFSVSYIVAGVVGVKSGYGLLDSASFMTSSAVSVFLRLIFGLLRWVSCYKLLRFCGVRHRVLLIILMIVGGDLAQGIILLCVSGRENADKL